MGAEVLNNYESGECMPRGKKTPPEMIYAVMTSWAVTDNVNETAKLLGLSFSTVKGIVEKNKDKPEFAKLRDKKKDDFSKRADSIINKALSRLEKDIDDKDKDIPVNHLTTVIGTLTDKKLLLEGKPTENVNILTGANIDKLAEIAGYEKRK